VLRRSGVLRLTRATVDVHVIAVVMAAAAPRTGAGMLAGSGVGGGSLGLALFCTTPGAGMSAGTGVGWSLGLTRMLAGAAFRV